MQEIESAFNRALLHSFSRKKFWFAFPALLICGILTIFCRAVAVDASDWIAISLFFLPIFLSSGVLFMLGVLLTEMYDREVKGFSLHLKQFISKSIPLLIKTSYFSVPSLLLYLCLWILLGIFFLFREIPTLGEFFSVIFSFGPFLLLFGAILLVFFNLIFLFFVTPFADQEPVVAIQRIFSLLKAKILRASLLFMVALFPLGVTLFLLVVAALFTNISFSIGEKSLAIAFEWFFIMIPFSFILTFPVLFFFNFASESAKILYQQMLKNS